MTLARDALRDSYSSFLWSQQWCDYLPAIRTSNNMSYMLPPCWRLKYSESSIPVSTPFEKAKNDIEHLFGCVTKVLDSCWKFVPHTHNIIYPLKHFHTCTGQAILSILHLGESANKKTATVRHLCAIPRNLDLYGSWCFSLVLQLRYKKTKIRE